MLILSKDMECYASRPAFIIFRNHKTNFQKTTKYRQKPN